MFSPNPAPSTAGSGYTRARTPRMTQTALSAMFPTATTTEGLTATELASQSSILPLLMRPKCKDSGTDRIMVSYTTRLVYYGLRNSAMPGPLTPRHKGTVCGVIIALSFLYYPGLTCGA